MAIVATLSAYQFIDMMQTARPDNFTASGLRVLFDYLDTMSDDCGTALEFDAIGIACEYSEMNAIEVYSRYSPELNLDDDEQLLFDLHYNTEQVHLLEDMLKPKIIEYLEYNTIIAGVTNSGSLVFADL